MRHHEYKQVSSSLSKLILFGQNSHKRYPALDTIQLTPLCTSPLMASCNMQPTSTVFSFPEALDNRKQWWFVAKVRRFISNLYLSWVFLGVDMVTQEQSVWPRSFQSWTEIFFLPRRFCIYKWLSSSSLQVHCLQAVKLLPVHNCNPFCHEQSECSECEAFSSY